MTLPGGDGTVRIASRAAGTVFGDMALDHRHRVEDREHEENADRGTCSTERV